MVNATAVRRLPVPSARQAAWAVLVVNLQLVAVVAYYAFTSATLVQPRYAVYGLVWVNVGVLAILRARPPTDVAFATRQRAIAVAAAYFGLLAVFGGLVSPGLGEFATGLRIAWLPPGWGPAVLYGGSHVALALTPAFVVGYVALSYLVYATVLEASRSAVAGVVGLFSCVSCTWPVLAAIASSILGGAGILGASAVGTSWTYYYDLSTVVFLVTVALLSWRPGFR